MKEVALVFVGGFLGIIGTIISSAVSHHYDKKKEKEAFYAQATNVLFLFKIYNKLTDKIEFEKLVFDSITKMRLYEDNVIANHYIPLVKDLLEHLGDDAYYKTRAKDINFVIDRIKTWTY